jgi:hypothetical protein
MFPQLENQFEQVRQAIRLGSPIKTPRMTLEDQGELHYADVMVYPLMADRRQRRGDPGRRCDRPGPH